MDQLQLKMTDIQLNQASMMAANPENRKGALEGGATGVGVALQLGGPLELGIRSIQELPDRAGPSLFPPLHTSNIYTCIHVYKIEAQKRLTWP